MNELARESGRSWAAHALILLAAASGLASPSRLAADETVGQLRLAQAQAQENALPRLPVQEGDDPIGMFVPAQPITDEEKLKGDALAWFMTAQLHYSRGENAEGLAALKKVVDKDPQSLTPYRAIVPALLESRDLDGAKEYALKAAALKPEGIVLSQGVALTLAARLNRVSDAIDLLNKTLPLASKETAFPQFLSLNSQIGRLHKLATNYKDAARFYEIVFGAIQSAEPPLTTEKIKELLGEPGVLYDEFGQTFLLASQPDLALKAFDEAAKYRTARPGIHSFNLALLFRETGKPDQALSELEKYFAAQLQTKGRQAYQLYADILKDLNREGELIGKLEKLREADSQNASLAFFLADQYLAAERLDDALKLYENAPGGSRDPRALVGMTAVYRQRKDIPKLFETLPKADQVAPAATDASVNIDPELRDLAIRFLGEREAIASSDELMKGLIDHAHALQKDEKLEFFPARFMGNLCILADKSDEALAFYRYAISMQNRPDAELYLQIGLHLIQTNKFKPAIEILGEAVAHPTLDDERPFFIQLQVAALEMDGQTDKATAVITKARSDYPNELRILEREAWVYYHSQQWQKAITAYEALIAAGPALNANREFLNSCRFSLSAIYVHIEEFDKGEKILEDVLAKDPENTQANNDLGYLWADRGKNLEKAKGMIEKALAEEPENAAYLDSMGWVEFRLGNYAAAREHLLKATEGSESTGCHDLGPPGRRLRQAG